MSILTDFEAEHQQDTTYALAKLVCTRNILAVNLEVFGVPG